MSEHSTKGKLITIDLWLKEMPQWAMLKAVCEAALAESKMTIVDSTFKHFEPEGTTAVWVLAESHMAIHTYPEHKFIAVDIFTCGEEGDPAAAVVFMARKLSVDAFDIKEAIRGVRPTSTQSREAFELTE